MNASQGARLAARAGLVALIALGAAAFGLWRADRDRAWEEPAWDPRAFPRVALDRDAARGGAGADLPREPSLASLLGAGAARDDLPVWVVAVNPSCARCMSGFKDVAAARVRLASPVRLVALIVDTAAPPGAGDLGSLGADAVHWDRDRRWRVRWGHRLYGEALVFTPGGRHIRTIPPDDVEGSLPASNLGVPPDDL